MKMDYETEEQYRAREEARKRDEERKKREEDDWNNNIANPANPVNIALHIEGLL